MIRNFRKCNVKADEVNLEKDRNNWCTCYNRKKRKIDFNFSDDNDVSADSNESKGT